MATTNLNIRTDKDSCSKEHIDGGSHIQSQLGKYLIRLLFNILIGSDV